MLTHIIIINAFHHHPPAAFISLVFKMDYRSYLINQQEVAYHRTNKLNNRPIKKKQAIKKKQQATNQKKKKKRQFFYSKSKLLLFAFYLGGIFQPISISDVLTPATNTSP